MALSFLSPARCVLLVGDEALYVYDVSPRGARLVDTVPWQVDNFEDNVKELITKECGGKPVLILNDMTDQHFKGGQRLPRVGMMDKSNVLKRKLQMAFPNYPIRGALPIKQDKSQKAALKTSGSQSESKAKVGSGLYLFAAVPMSEPIVKTIRAVQRSMASVAGFVLLPVEAADMVKALSEKAVGKGKKAARWVLFVGQHQNGDLRQVIIRDGQLAMTRMTSVTDNDSSPGAWAQEVHQEIKATVSYLSRFGYSPDDGTHMIVIANPQAGDALEKLLEFPCQYNSYTAPQAAQILGVKIGTQDEPRYADPLHAAWTGRKTKFILPMQAAEMSKIHRPRQVASLAIFLLLLGGAYLAWDMMGRVQSLIESRENLSQQRRVLAQVETEYEHEVERLEALGFDVKLIQGSARTYEQFEQERIGLLPVMQKVAQALGNDIRIDGLSVQHEMEIKEDENARWGGRQDEPETAPVFDVRLTLTFPAEVGAEYGILTTNNLALRLGSVLPSYEVDIVRQVASPEYSAPSSGTAGSDTEVEEDFIAVLSLRGPHEDN